MRKLIAVLIALPLLWAGYWFFGSYGLKSELETWLTDRRADGWQVEYTGLDVRGFPNRFDTTLTEIQLADPETGINWQAPFFQLLSLSYKPNHVIAVWPKSQVFSTPFQSVDIFSEDMKASVVLAPNADFALQRGTLIAGGLKMNSTADWNLDVSSFATSIRQLERKNEYEFSSEIQSLKPSKTLRDWLDRQKNLPAIIENISVDLVSTLSEPIDRKTVEDARPQIEKLEISQAKATWGELLLRASGELTTDSTGAVSGVLKLNAKNWREMIKVAVSAGALSADIARAAEFGLGLLARLNGSETTLDTVLTFQDGRMFLGPIPLGAAPKLKIR